uniref:Uncharacterized protein n=1 Tax=Anopheles farauti TaxID=69004 RepID=A0A182Q5P0_9DIPT
MKLLLALISFQIIGLAYAQDSSLEDRKTISYESKIYHKIPDKTIVEDKTEDLKKPLSAEKAEPIAEEKSSVPSYEFGYGVKDPITGDHKDQWEKRHGDHVKGAYRFDESDGTQRVVEYEADGKKGFEATVKNVERKDAAAVDDEEGSVVDAKKKALSHLRIRMAPANIAPVALIDTIDLLHHSLEPVLVVRLVLHHTLRSIGLIQRVLTLYMVSDTLFPLLLLIACRGIMHTVGELVQRETVVVAVLLLLLTRTILILFPLFALHLGELLQHMILPLVLLATTLFPLRKTTFGSLHCFTIAFLRILKCSRTRSLLLTFDKLTHPFLARIRFGVLELTLWSFLINLTDRRRPTFSVGSSVETCKHVVSFNSFDLYM